MVEAEDFTDASAVAVDPAVPSRWRCVLRPSWDTPRGLHGGMVTVAGLRAILAEIDDPGLVLRSSRTLFLEPPDRDLCIDVRDVRRGGLTAHVEAVLHGGDPTHPSAIVTALAGRARPSDDYQDSPVPDVAAWDALASDPTFGDAAQDPFFPPLFAHFDSRIARGVLPFDPAWAPGQEARFCRWHRYHLPPRTASGALDPLSIVPFADLPAPAMWVRFGPDEPFYAPVSLDLQIHYLEPPTDEWILSDARARHLGDAYVVTETDLWSGGRLVAISSQTMLARALPPLSSDQPITLR